MIELVKMKTVYLDKKNYMTSILAAMCFFFSLIEVMIPKPVPFFRLGVANLPVILALEMLDFPHFMLLVVIKTVGQGMLNGTMFSFIFLLSAGAGISSALAMYAVKKVLKERITSLGVSIAGALTSNIVQIFISEAFIFGENAFLIAPFLLSIGLVTSIIIGFVASFFIEKSVWMKKITMLEGDSFGICLDEEDRKSPLRIVFGTVLFFLLIFTDDFLLKAGIFFFIVAMVMFFRQKIRLFPCLVMSFSILFLNVFTPCGKVIFSVFSLPITDGALISGLKKVFTVEGSVFLSRFIMSGSSFLHGKIGDSIRCAFQLMNILAEKKKDFSMKKPFQSMDKILLSMIAG